MRPIKSKLFCPVSIALTEAYKKVVKKRKNLSDKIDSRAIKYIENSDESMNLWLNLKKLTR